MTPEQFAKEMQRIKDDESGDIEKDHGESDDLLCKVLKELGYGEGIKIYESMEKWYA